MGLILSNSVAPRRTLTDTPWRDIKDWDRKTREELRKQVESLAPVTKKKKVKVPFFNIFLIGQTKSGKSSFYNSIDGLFRNQVIANKADAGEAAQSLTKEFGIYEVRTSADADPLPWRIWDTMGLDTNTGEVDVKNILNAVDGHVPDQHRDEKRNCCGLTCVPCNFVFTCGIDCRRYVANSTLANQAHCVAIVVNASQVNHLTGEVLSQLRALREGLMNRRIPMFIILTHIDQVCEQVNQNVRNVHNSIIIRDIVSKVSRQFGLTENQIFPVKNYTNEVELRDDVDILILYALRQMLYSAQGHIENKI